VRLAALVVLAIGCAACGGASRFALRTPVLRVDDRPLLHAPANDETPDGANAVDMVVLRPLSHAFTPALNEEARDVNALDEVPDSAWFTNRTTSPQDLVRGPCGDAPLPTVPFTVKTTKVGGVTLGFVVNDARHQKYVLKLDELAQYGQPEISTAADAVASRLYWAIGFNAPCNDVLDVRPSDIRVNAQSAGVTPMGHRKPLTAKQVAETLLHATPAADGKVRVTASRFIDGQVVGTWSGEGTRHDDPNDVIPHEARRELRGEMTLAGWLAHWDSRRQNTYDTFVPERGGGHVVHYFLDFSDAIGGTISRTLWAQPRSGYEGIVDLSTILTDMFGFGFLRRPWDDLRTDPLFPNLGFLDVEHFEPLHFVAQTPLVRWARAQRQDTAWMARRIALISEAHVRVAVAAGHFTHPAEEARLVEILMGRRTRILRTSFATTSPLADFTLRRDELCATDLARATGVSTDASTSYAAEFRFGRHLLLAPVSPRLVRTPQGVCTEMPPHFAPQGAAQDSADRYATIDLLRFEGHSRTRLRAHFYDLGARGYVLVGIERL
jgi:hypothetical protein